MEQNIDAYITTQLASGYSIGDIRKALLVAGWPEPEVNAALASAQAQHMRQEQRRSELLIGAPLAVLAGIGLLALSPFVAPSLVSVAEMFPPLIVVADTSILNILFGLGLIIGGGLAGKGRRAGGALVIVLALLYFLFGGDILLSAVALIAGILGVKGR